MALPRMDDPHAAFPTRLEQARQRFDRRARLTDVVAHLGDVTSFPTKVRLHVDDHERNFIERNVCAWPRVWRALLDFRSFHRNL